jgi:hypothetical protein
MPTDPSAPSILEWQYDHYDLPVSVDLSLTSALLTLRLRANAPQAPSPIFARFVDVEGMILEPLLASVRDKIQASPSCQRFLHLRAELAEGQKQIGLPELQKKITALEADKKAALAGTEKGLAKRIGELDQQLGKLASLKAVKEGSLHTLTTAWTQARAAAENELQTIMAEVLTERRAELVKSRDEKMQEVIEILGHECLSGLVSVFLAAQHVTQHPDNIKNVITDRIADLLPAPPDPRGAPASDSISLTGNLLGQLRGLQSPASELPNLVGQRISPDEMQTATPSPSNVPALPMPSPMITYPSKESAPADSPAVAGPA